MPRWHSTRRAIVLQHERWDHRGRLGPSALCRQQGAEPHLDVEAPEHLLDVPDSTLYLDNDKAARAGMPCHQVAAAPVAVVVEADLCLRDPACSPKSLGGSVLEGGVRAIDEPIEVGSAPPEIDDERRVQRGCEPRQGAQGQSIERASLGA